MKYYELTIFIKRRKKYLCKALFENKKLLDDFIENLESPSRIVRIGDIIFNKEDFWYGEIEEKTIY